MQYGDLLLITKGKHRGRIGLYDDDDERKNDLIVYFVSPSWSDDYYIIRKQSCTLATLADIRQRIVQLRQELYVKQFVGNSEETIKILNELVLILSQL